MSKSILSYTSAAHSPICIGSSSMWTPIFSQLACMSWALGVYSPRLVMNFIFMLKPLGRPALASRLLAFSTSGLTYEGALGLKAQ